MNDPMNSATVGEAPKLPKVAPDGLAASIILAFLTTAGLFYVNIMPALVSGLIDGLGFSQKTAGYVASANVYGASLGAFTSVFLVKKLPWRRTAVVTLLALVAIDLVSTLVLVPEVLIPLRFVHGTTGGLLVGVGFAVIARTHAPDKSFGMLLMVQYGLGGVGLMTLPRLVPLFGTPVLFYALILFSLATLCMIPFLGSYPAKQHSLVTAEDESGARLYIKPLILGLLAVFAFQAANMGLAAYVIELGKHYGLTTGSISTTLGIANWIAVLGAVAVYVVGIRNGRLKPIVAGTVITLVGMALFHFSAYQPAFVAANIITGITWAFLIPYLLGMCSAFDGHGQMAALSGFFSKMGLASGPLVAALVVGDGAYDLIINLALFGTLLSLVAAFLPAQLLDERDTPHSGNE